MWGGGGDVEMNSEETGCVTVGTGLNWLRIEAFEAPITMHKSKRFNAPEDVNVFVFGLCFLK
jgi:hypothetical protein